MSVSKQDKEVCALGGLNILVERLIKEYGYNVVFWLRLIYTSTFILNLMDVKTGYWGEGVVFHESKLLKELNLNVVCNKYKVDKKAKDSCWLVIHILYGMEKLCHLSIEEISDIVAKTSLIDFLVENYSTLLQEGMVASLQSVKRFLEQYNIDISIDYSIAGEKKESQVDMI